jgi:hypothetical protein
MRIPILSEIARDVSPLSFKEWLVLLLILLPAILEVAYIRSFGVNVVYWDQWDFIPYIEKMFQHNLSLSDLFQQHNEHRLFFPRIIMLILAYFSNYNNLYEMYFSWTLAVLILILIFTMYKPSFKVSIKSLIYFIPISFIIFNFRQYENILWGFQLQIYLGVLGFLFALYMLGESNELCLNFLLAILGGILASYSFANGLATWPVGLFFLLISNKERKLAYFWSLAGILVMGLYFSGWAHPSGHPSIFFILNKPFDGVLYLLVNIGSSLAHDKHTAVGVGIFLVIVLFIELIYLYEFNIFRSNSMWLSLILFSLISSVITTVGRAGFGAEQALSSRYVTFTLIGVIGIYILALNLYNMKSHDRILAILFGVVVSILIIGSITGYTSGISAGKSLKEARLDSAYYLKTYKLQPDYNFQGLYHSPRTIRSKAPFLETYNLNAFTDNDLRFNGLIESQATTLYSIDAINAKSIKNKINIINKSDSKSIKITGWAVDWSDGTLAKAVFISIDNKLIMPTRYYVDRVDVANYFNNRNFRYSGFMSVFNISSLDIGSHNLTLRVISNGGDKYYKSSPINIDLVR